VAKRISISTTHTSFGRRCVCSPPDTKHSWGATSLKLKPELAAFYCFTAMIASWSDSLGQMETWCHNPDITPSFLPSLCLSFKRHRFKRTAQMGGCKASARVAHGSQLSSLRPSASAPARRHYTLRSIFICHSTPPSIIRCVRAQICHAQLHLQAVRPPRRYITSTKLAERP
jgi:hypothetical protein